MTCRRRQPARPARPVVAVVVAVVAAAAGAACSSDATSEDTLGPLAGSGSAATASAAPTGTVAAETTAARPGPAGAGVVRLAVRVTSTGADEILMLDRATVEVAALDPVSLDAACTALDGGAGLTVSVIDLRRVSAGNRLLSAVLRVEGEVPGPGDYPATLEVGDADQQVTSFEGTVQVDAGLASGTFDVADGSGSSATGSFACAADEASLPTTTTIAPVPASDVTTSGTGETTSPSIVIVPTVPPSIGIARSDPPATVPEATS